MVVASLTLEIYIVQFHIITDKFNSVFPMNTIIVFALITLAAYLLRFLVNVFVQFIGKDNWNWKGIMKL